MPHKLLRPGCIYGGILNDYVTTQTNKRLASEAVFFGDCLFPIQFVLLVEATTLQGSNSHIKWGYPPWSQGCPQSY